MNKTFYVVNCDKCGRKVYPLNSALLLEDVVYNQVGFFGQRHLFPTEEGCEGSPSRVKMLQTDAAWAEAYQQIKATEFELIDLSEALT